jgi:hypothetical protein
MTEVRNQSPQVPVMLHTVSPTIVTQSDETLHFCTMILTNAHSLYGDHITNPAIESASSKYIGTEFIN